MATWTDGPEYAPHERPAVFQAPAVEPLATPLPAERHVLGAAAAPEAMTAPTAPPLEALSPRPGRPARDPRAMFEIAHAGLTGTWAFGSLQHDPRDPILVQGRDAFTAPAAPAAAAAGAPASWPTPHSPGWFVPQQLPNPDQLTIKDWAHAMSPGLVFSLAIGCLPIVTAPVFYLLAAFFGLNARYRRRSITVTFVTGLAIISIFSGLALISDGMKFTTWWTALASASAWVSGGTFAVVASTIFFALHSQETPVSTEN